MAAPGFWDNQEKAQAVVLQLKSLKTVLKPLEDAVGAAAELGDLLEMASEDDSLAAEVRAECKETIAGYRRDGSYSGGS